MISIALGVDIGGTGIKAAPVDVQSGDMLAERHRQATPQPATPQSVAGEVAQIMGLYELPADAPVGVAFPAVVQHGVSLTATNIDHSWIGTNIEVLLGEATGRRVHALNDADAAGLAESRYGAAKGVSGVVLMITLGTGIGSALIVDGQLVPNTELGRLEIDGQIAESRASERARKAEQLDWEEWAERLQRYFDVVESLFSPDLIVVGGGVSKHHAEFLPLLRLKAPVTPAALLNAAGVVGAAVWAADREGS